MNTGVKRTFRTTTFGGLSLLVLGPTPARIGVETPLPPPGSSACKTLRVRRAWGLLSGNRSSPHPRGDAGMAVEFRSSGRPEEDLDGVIARCIREQTAQ